MALPCRFGGLGIVVSSPLATQYDSSRAITALLTQRVMAQEQDLGDSVASVRSKKQEIRSQAKDFIKTEVTQFMSALDLEQARVISLVSEKGTSNWLTCRPLKRHGFAFTKGESTDGIRLRCNWLPPRLPSHCSCGTSFTTSHALSCPTGGFPSIRHNEVRDTTAKLLNKVSHNVAVEPHLQPVTGEQFHYRTTNVGEQAHLDVAASGIWGDQFECTFIDVRVFNPYASSNCTTSLASSYTRQEREKKRRYEQQIREIEHASFVPTVFATTRGIDRNDV